jgi:hypothetical protein
MRQNKALKLWPCNTVGFKLIPGPSAAKACVEIEGLIAALEALRRQNQSFQQTFIQDGVAGREESWIALCVCLDFLIA